MTNISIARVTVKLAAGMVCCNITLDRFSLIGMVIISLGNRTFSVQFLFSHTLHMWTLLDGQK